MTTTAAKRGSILEMGGRSIHFRPLNWATLELLQEDLDRVAGMSINRRSTPFFTPEERTSVLTVVHTAISASNDGITLQWVKENLDLANVGPVMEAVFTTNGFITEPSEGSTPGEAQAAGSGN